MLKKIKGFLTENSTSRQTIVKNAFWIGFGNIFGRVIRGIFVIYAARILGAADYGVFSYALGLAAFFTIFGDLGISGVFIRETSKNPERADEYFSVAFIIKILFSFLAALLLIVSAPFISNIQEVRVLLPLVALLIIGDNIQNFFIAVFRVKEHMELEAFVVLITNIIITLSGFIILKIHPTVHALTFTYISAVFLGSLPTFFMVKKELLNIFKSFKKNLIGPFLSAGTPFALQGVFGGLMLNTDMLILGWMRTTQEIGIYSAGQRIIYILYLLPTILAGSIFPILSRFIGKKEQEKTQVLIEKTMSILFSIAIPLTVGGIILSTPILSFLFGIEYISGALSFQFLIATVIFVFPLSILINITFANNQQGRFLFFTVIAAITNLILDVIFIRLWGIAGCSLATLLVQIIYTTLTWRFVRKYYIFSVIKYLKKVVLASIIMGLFSLTLNYIFNLHILITITISIIIYFITLYILKEPIIKEIVQIFKPNQIKN